MELIERGELVKDYSIGLVNEEDEDQQATEQKANGQVTEPLMIYIEESEAAQPQMADFPNYITPPAESTIDDFDLAVSHKIVKLG